MISWHVFATKVLNESSCCRTSPFSSKKDEITVQVCSWVISLESLSADGGGRGEKEQEQDPNGTKIEFGNVVITVSPSFSFPK